MTISEGIKISHCTPLLGTEYRAFPTIILYNLKGGCYQACLTQLGFQVQTKEITCPRPVSSLRGELGSEWLVSLPVKTNLSPQPNRRPHNPTEDPTAALMLV